MIDPMDKARQLAESAVAALLAERAKRGGQIVAEGVVWNPQSEAPAQEVSDSSPSREAIEAFLGAELAGGLVPVKRLHERAVAAGLLPEGEGPPLWRRKPWRSAARGLGVEHHQQDREWFWGLPTDENVGAPEQIDQGPVKIDQGPTGMSAVLSPEPTDSDNMSPQGDIATAPDTVTDGAESVTSDSPSTPTDDIVAARRRFAEQMLDWWESDECREVMAEGRRQADEIIARDYERLGLTNPFQTRQDVV
jgi:hypothetical protein